MFGADGGPEVVVRGAARALMAQTEYDIVFAGSSLIARIVLQEEASRMNFSPAGLMQRVSVIETNSFVTNMENPKKMVKDRNDTSLVLALEAMRDDAEIKAMVTAGNTGCALVGSCFHLGLQKGLLQPALASALPREGGGYTLLLDCGSNLEPGPRELEQYAQLGSAFVRNSYGVSIPVVGLLNVGKEKGKGTENLQEAYKKIEAAAEQGGFVFAGNIEGGEILGGKLDVVICDGFTGNVIIKGFESVGMLCAELAASSERFKIVLNPDRNVRPSEKLPDCPGENGKTIFRRQLEDPWNLKAAEDSGAPGSAMIRRWFDYNSQAGAIFLGTKKLIVKAHGAATEETICSCILQAVNLCRGNREMPEQSFGTNGPV